MHKQRPFKEGKIAIPIRSVVEVYEKLADVLGRDNVVIIGGQATNSWCSKQRNSHDIDIVTRNPITIEEFEKLQEMGFFQRVNDKYKFQGFDYNDHYFGNIRIDVMGQGRPVSGIDVSTLFDNKVTKYPFGYRRSGFESIEVADKGLLTIMKFNSKRDVDIEDIKNILHNHYKGSISEFVRSEDKLLKRVYGDRSDAVALNYRELLDGDAFTDVRRH